MELHQTHPIHSITRPLQRNHPMKVTVRRKPANSKVRPTNPISINCVCRDHLQPIFTSFLSKIPTFLSPTSNAIWYIRRVKRGGRCSIPCPCVPSWRHVSRDTPTRLLPPTVPRLLPGHSPLVSYCSCGNIFTDTHTVFHTRLLLIAHTLELPKEFCSINKQYTNKSAQNLNKAHTKFGERKPDTKVFVHKKKRDKRERGREGKGAHLRFARRVLFLPIPMHFSR